MGIDKVGTRESISSRGRGWGLANNGFWFPDKVESEKGNSECSKVGRLKWKNGENDVVECNSVDSS
jgi:hypothetical protein